MTSTDFSENALVEQPAIELLQQLGWQAVNGFAEKVGTAGATLGRQTTADVILWPRLDAALRRLNPSLPDAALQQAVEILGKDRGALGLAHANREVYQLLKDGVRVSYTNDEGDEVDDVVRVIDWNNSNQNDFLVVSQLWVSGPIYKRRADLVGFINGLPLLFIELKKAHGRLEHAYTANLRDYKQTVPQLFWYNALILLSNGSESKVGSVTSGWEHFGEWKRISSEGETGVISLETVLRGTCEPTRFLDLVENFTLFDESKGGLVKVTAKNHQFLGVNNAVAALWEIRQNQGRLGVFWHTQGSGKSFSMVFFAQKVLRKIPGNWTFVVVTDRDDLDNQIYRNFRNCGAATEECQAESGEHLQQLLTEDHRFVFTLIQKFGTREGRQYPKLSDREDIILMTDEAHRSQYDTLALNMRNALPKAAFIGFTGTPLMAGEEQTRRVFGDYVSIYNFRQSLEDRATVPLFYENRVPELQLTNENLKDDLEALIDQTDLNDDQQKKLERVFAREYHLITRGDRLEKIAEDLVAHFLGREQGGKGMVICIDKLTAVRMYEKVQRHWKAHLADLQAELPLADAIRRPTLEAQIEFLKTTDMAVVISSQQNEVAEFEKRGIDIRPHRERMVREDLETKFKNPDDPFRLVFVCAMWLTGFDAPCVSTVYLDKPMKNHTLMQTIARANRVFREKVNGLIVDYVGVFRDLQRALSIYGAAEGGNGEPVDSPIQSKDELVAALKQALADALAFCEERGVVLNAIVDSTGFQRIAHLDDAASRLVDRQVNDALDDSVEKILVNDELKKKFLGLVDHVVRLYKAILPDAKANQFTPLKTCLAVLAEKIRAFSPEVDIDDVMEEVEELLDNSIATVGYVIHATEKTSPIDLGEIDFEALKEHFEKSRKRTEAEKLRGLIQRKLADLVRKNKSRVELGEKLKKLIDEYNKGQDVDSFFAQLLNFARELTAEERRGVADQLSEEELAVFDILTRPAPDLSAAERKQVKKVARNLLQTLKQAKLVLDWRTRLRTRADVLATVKTILDELPRVYTKELYEEKCETVWQHVYDSYFGEGESVYGRV